MIHLCGPGDKIKDYINTTSRATGWSRGLSPFVLGPVRLYDGHTAMNVENGWQFAKVYKEHVDIHGQPTKHYWDWAIAGWNNPRAVRYPMGKGALPLYSLWKGQKLTYVEARKKIYCPLYARAVRKTEAFKELVKRHDYYGDLWLWDFDSYNHRALGMTYQDVIDCPNRKMGHAFVLAMLLENECVWKTRKAKG